MNAHASGLGRGKPAGAHMPVAHPLISCMLLTSNGGSQVLQWSFALSGQERCTSCRPGRRVQLSRSCQCRSGGALGLRAALCMCSFTSLLRAQLCVLALAYA